MATHINDENDDLYECLRQASSCITAQVYVAVRMLDR